MSDLVIYRFQPDATDENVLRKLFVGRRDLFDEMRDEIERAVDNRTPRYYLVVGPRGIGKSHFITLLYYELRKLKDVLCVKFSEDEFSIYRTSDFFSRIFEEIEGKKSVTKFKMDNSELIDAILEDLKSRSKMIIIFVENLYQILEKQMEEREIKQLRSIFQEEDIFIVIATSPLAFDAVSQGNEPFYNFFNIKHLKELSGKETREMIEIIDELEGKLKNAEQYYKKIDSVVKLTGGSPRIIILLYDLMCKGDILDIEDAFFKILDEYTPYYQDVFRNLTGQKRRIFDVLISLGKPSTPRKIATTARLGNNTVITQLRRLEKDGYVLSHGIGKRVKYDVRERLLRLWREQRHPLGRKRLSILIEFIKLWYTPEERKKELLSMISRLKAESRFIKKLEYLFYTFSEKSKIKFMPEIARESYRHGVSELFEEIIGTEDEKLRKAFVSEKLKIIWKYMNYDGLLEETEKIIKEDKRNEIAWYNKGLALWNLQRCEEALQAFDRALGVFPEYASAWHGKGLALWYLQRYEEALQAFDRALEVNPKLVHGLVDRGLALWNLQRYEEALQAFDRALEVNPEYYSAWHGKGLTLLNLQRYEEALQAFDRALEINPEYADAWYNKGITLRNLQRYEEALQAFDRALEINPEYADAWHFKGITLSHLQRYGEALQALDRALEIAPKGVDAWTWYSWYAKGFALLEFQRYEEALQAFDRALEINPRYIYALESKGIVLWNLQRYEEALQAFDRALEINPEYADAWDSKGIVLSTLKRYEEALQAFDRALEINSEDADALFHKGIASYYLRNYEKTLQAFNRVLEINPEDVDAQLGRGEAHLEISKYDFKQINYGNAIENLNAAMDSFSGIWDTQKQEIRNIITGFFKDLTDSEQIEAVDISLKTILKKKGELVEFLKPIFVSLDIIRNEDLTKYYDIQVEERDLVVDIIRKLTGSEDLIPEEYRKVTVSRADI